MNWPIVLSAIAAVGAFVAAAASVANVVLTEGLRRSAERKSWERQTLVPICARYLEAFNECRYAAFGMMGDMTKVDAWWEIRWQRAVTASAESWKGMRALMPTIELLCDQAVVDAAGAMVVARGNFEMKVAEMVATPHDQLTADDVAMRIADQGAELTRAADKFIAAVRQSAELSALKPRVGPRRTDVDK